MTEIRTDTDNMTTAQIRREFDRIEQVTNALAVALNDRGVLMPNHLREQTDAELCRDFAMMLRRQYRRMRHRLGRNAPGTAHHAFMSCAQAAEQFDQAADTLEVREKEVAA